MKSMASHPQYVLITPARNEGQFIENTIRSVIGQTALPSRWVIVNDGSTDNTAMIVARYAATYDWIKLVNLAPRQGRDFAAKVYAFKSGQEMLSGIEYEVIGNLDADVSLDRDHFEFLIGKFQEDPDLGVAGTVFREPGYNSATDSFEGQNYVSGQCQIFRRQCFEAIGGYVPSKAGGIDWIAVNTARMMGWKTQSFREKCFYHHRILGTANHGVIGKFYAYGKKDYLLGGHPLWEVFRCGFRVVKQPYLFGAMALLAGYVGALVRGEMRVVSNDLMRFHRREQLMKLRTIVLCLVRLKKIDSFNLLPVAKSSRPRNELKIHEG
jgi:glycosyltransferase involved in cell wall biosynthesis